MKKTLIVCCLFSMLTLIALPIQANFVLCPGGVCSAAQGITDDADLINGSLIGDDITAQMGDDVLFGNDGIDILRGDEGNDILLGGLDDDSGFGGPGNDVILPGPDASPDSRQYFNGTEGNDMTIVFAGEISGCLAVDDAGGSDTVNLVGFGPYSASVPFGQPGFGNAYVLVTDPITGGFIAIHIVEDNDFGIEVINGLVSPSVTILAFGDLSNTCQSAFN